MNKLRLIRGINRSGTSWFLKILTQTSTPIKAINELLFSIKDIVIYKYPKCIQNNCLDIFFETSYSLPTTHPLIISYKGALEGKLKNNKRVLRNDKNWETCIIKDIHSLLATEALIRTFHCPTILLVRDPVYIVDSFLAIRQWQTAGKPNPETKLVITSNKEDTRLSTIIRMLISFHLIHKYFRTWAKLYPKYIRLIQYENLCKEPLNTFKDAAEFFCINWTNSMENYLNNTMKGTDTGAYSIFRNTENQIKRPMKFLTSQEVKICRKLLRRIDK